MAYPTEDFLRSYQASGCTRSSEPEWITDWKKIKQLDEYTFIASSHGLREGLEAMGGNPLRHAVVSGNEAAFDRLVGEGYSPDADMMRFLVEDAIQFSDAPTEQHIRMLEKMMAAGVDPTAQVDWSSGSESPIEHASRLSGHEVASVMGACMRHGALSKLAGQAPPQEDLTTPEQALAARQARYGRAM